MYSRSLCLHSIFGSHCCTVFHSASATLKKQWPSGDKHKTTCVIRNSVDMTPTHHAVAGLDLPIIRKREITPSQCTRIKFLWLGSEVSMPVDNDTVNLALVEAPCAFRAW